MCGIVAIAFPKNEPEAREAISRMVVSLRHRGPDAEHAISRPGCLLGHTRLSIIDLEGGAQPMADPSGRWWITFNGEIYNYRELRRELEQRGRRFATRSDTEVLLQGFAEYGEKVVDRLNGQFAFVIWDEASQELFAARDRMGEKPLYWASTSHGLLIASELKAMLTSRLVAPRIDRVSVDAYLGLLYVPPHRTIYENISVVPPGHWLKAARGQAHLHRYWEPRLSVEPVGKPEEVVDRVRGLIEQAVRRQMVADVPVGAFLSGGLDSSTVVALMAKVATGPVATFSVGFGDLIDELPFARMVAAQYGTQHHELQMEIGVAEMLERMAATYDEPFADSSSIPTYLISGFARQHVKAVLSGDGADELFGGYDWYRLLLDADRINATLAARLTARLAMLGSRWAARYGWVTGATVQEATRRHLRTNLKYRYVDLWDRHLAGSGHLVGRRAVRCRAVDGHTAYDDVAATYRPGTEVSGIDRAVDFDLRSYLPGDILVKVDRASMAHGLETRAPFLDVDLVNYVTSLPAGLRFARGSLKSLLRDSCGNLWPEKIRVRGKQGFGAPIGTWLQRPDVLELMKRVGGSGHPLASVVPGARALLSPRTPQPAWTLLCLGLWLERNTECLNHH